MNKNLMTVILFPVVVDGHIIDPFEAERDVDIITDRSTYIIKDELKIFVSFTNNLSRDIRIVNSGDSNPSFILEKKIGDSWTQVYSTICIELYYVEATFLKSMGSLITQIRIQAPEIKTENLTGEFRFGFDLIEKENYNSLPDKYLCSNVFKIKEEI